MERGSSRGQPSQFVGSSSRSKVTRQNARTSKSTKMWQRGEKAARVLRLSHDGPVGTYGDNSSIMRTVEGALTKAVNRFVGRICDLAETRAPRPAREGNQRLRHSEPLAANRNCLGAKKADDATTEQDAQGAGGVSALSGRRVKPSKHDLRDGCFCRGARCHSWRSQMDLRYQTNGVRPTGGLLSG